MRAPDDNRVMQGVYHWLTPLLIVALASVIAWLGAAMLTQQSKMNQALTQIDVHLATLQSQAQYAQVTSAAMQSQIAQIIAEQTDHEHRITVLEQRYAPR